MSRSQSDEEVERLESVDLEPPTPAKDDTDKEDEPSTRSLNSIYGSKLGLLQSLSLLFNTAVMIYAHFGLSAIIISNQERIQDSVSNAEPILPQNSTADIIGSCVERDMDIWDAGGDRNKSTDTEFCTRGYRNPDTGRQCLLSTDCTKRCFEEVIGYTEPCASCFAQVPFCNFAEGCAPLCNIDPFGAECTACNAPCDAAFENCSGLVLWEGELNITGDNYTGLAGDNVCARQQDGVELSNITEYFRVYEILFFDAIHTAWFNNAKLLAVIVVTFSGIWPYAKNLLLMLAWYLPLRTGQRSRLLRWLRRLGKYTLVDIYVSRPHFGAVRESIVLLIIRFFFIYAIGGHYSCRWRSDASHGCWQCTSGCQGRTPWSNSCLLGGNLARVYAN